MTTTKTTKVKQSNFPAIQPAWKESNSSNKKTTSIQASARPPTSSSKLRGRAHTLTQQEKDSRYLKEKAEGNGKRYFQTTAKTDAEFIVNDVQIKTKKRGESSLRKEAKRGMSEEERRAFDKTENLIAKRLFK